MTTRRWPPACWAPSTSSCRPATGPCWSRTRSLPRTSGAPSAVPAASCPTARSSAPGGPGRPARRGPSPSGCGDRRTGARSPTRRSDWRPSGACASPRCRSATENRVRRRASAELLDVGLRVLVPDGDACVVPGLEGQELHRDLVPGLQVRVVPEVEQVLPLLLGHVVVVGLPRIPHGGPPLLAARLVPARRPNAVADLVVVLDRVLDLVVDVALGVALPEREKSGVEEALLRLRVHLEQHFQPPPDRGEPGAIVAGHLVKDGEGPPLLVVLLEDDLGDVHARHPPPAARAAQQGPPRCPEVRRWAHDQPEEVERQHTLRTAVARYEELRSRELLADSAGTESPDVADAERLPASEVLELLAVGEVTGRKAGYAQQLAAGAAGAAGASWTAIARALG